MGDRANKGILIGYENGNAYRIYLLDIQKVIISKDVYFKGSAKANPLHNSDSNVFEFNGFDIRDLFHLEEEGDSYNDLDQQTSSPPTEQPSKSASSASIPLNTELIEPNKSTNNIDSSHPIIYIPGLRISKRSTAGQLPARFQYTHVALMIQTVCSTLSKYIPRNCKQAVSGQDNVEWIEALNDEFKSLNNMKTWRLVILPKGRRAIRLKWVFDIKNDSKGGIEKYRTRIVAMGVFQKEGIEFVQFFATVFKYSALRLFFRLTARHGWKRFSIDVKCSFINAKLNEEIYVLQPEGFIQKGYEDHVYLLEKSIYGLKQAAKSCHNMLHKIILSIGFTQSWADRCLYIFQSGQTLISLTVYVDEIKLSGKNDQQIQVIINEFKKLSTIRLDEEDSKF